MILYLIAFKQKQTGKAHYDDKNEKKGRKPRIQPAIGSFDPVFSERRFRGSGNPFRSASPFVLRGSDATGKRTAGPTAAFGLAPLRFLRK
ncbi:MAG TPA: hypothetical protein VNQ90_08360 [Chthoniobacteraceae bacterium]|nr:hypothetical protein [Chthoniobacteraceae bacterium]